MPLTPDTQLGPYTIVSPLGAGGMGEVYRAKDTRLGREVAIKVLPRHLNAEPELRARFEREARTVSSLNHPHICVLHDVGREGDTDYLVMELVEGETLAQRLSRGGLPMPDVLRFGAQIADALDRAHRAGVVHRDLKPGNVMLTRSGAKLMDFGLARATGLAAGGSSIHEALTTSPTIVSPLTAEGSLVGTFQYMAPEQLEGKEADARADLWALGCVLYEMATGRRAFEGDSQASLIGSIMKDQPRPVLEAAPTAPAPLGRLVDALLSKDPDERIQTAHDAKLQLQWAAEPQSGSSGVHVAGAPSAQRGVAQLVAWSVAGVALVAAIGLGFVLLRSKPVTAAATRSVILPGTNVTLASSSTSAVPLAISADGTLLAYCAHVDKGADLLWVQRLATGEASALAGTEGASQPFFSPDGRQIAFFAAGKLHRVSAEGGPITTIAVASDPRGGSWGSRGVIAFAPFGGRGLFQVSAEGGEVTEATALDTTLGEATHRNPHFLPDGVHFLYLARRAGAGKGEQPAIFAASTGSSARTRVLEVASNIVYASGHLLYVTQGNLVAHAFDLGKRAVRGSVIPISSVVQMDERFSRGTFAASQNGVLVFSTGKAAQSSQLHWVDRQGVRLRPVGEPGLFTFGGSPKIDRSGTRATLPMMNEEQGVSNVWIVDLESGRRRRLSVDDEDHYAATWSADGRQVHMNSLLRNGGTSNVLSVPADGSGSSRIMAESPGYMQPESSSPDGRWLFVNFNDNSSFTVYALPTDGVGQRIRIGAGANSQTGAQCSPDGRLVAYASNESGRYEVYLASFPPPGGKWQASSRGGGHPMWSADGRELFYIDSGNHLVSLPVLQSASSVEFGAPQQLFQIYGSGGLTRRYAPSADGRRFLVSSDIVEDAARSITLITNWVKAVER